MPTAPADSIEGTRILLVEDDADIRDVLAGMLRDEGFHVTCGTNGREALGHLHHGPPPDVIVLDLMMPVMDGWQFRLEQKKDPMLASIPVVAMSADASAKAEAIDVDAYVRKPLEFNNLLARIHKVLEMARTQRLAAANRLAALGTLAAGIAHEVNNPLAYTMCNIQHLLDKVPPLLMGERSEVSQLLEEALEGTRRIAQVVKQALLVAPARPEENGVTDVRFAAELAIKRMQGEVHHRGAVETDFVGHPRVIGDRGRIEQIFTNLLLNAVQALPEGQPRQHTIRVGVRPLPSDRVLIEVADDGCGIAPEVQERIFQPFFTTKPIGEGAGLGLSICHGIVTALGGEISFESEPGRGTTFRVVLPTTAQPLATRDATPIAREVWPGGRILVVDEEPIMMRAVKYMLGPGHQVAFASNVEVALALLDEGAQFDVILCDVMLQNATGTDLVDVLADRHPIMAPRVVFMTAGGITPQARRLIDSGRYTCIEKPFDRKVLVDAVSVFRPRPLDEDPPPLNPQLPLQATLRPVQSKG